MAFFSRPENQIGRGEVAESRVEFPFFVAFMLVSAVGLLIFNSLVQNPELTAAAGISLLIFGVTLLRVEWGVIFLVVAMLLSPEISTGKVGMGNRSLQLRYDDVLIIVVFAGVLVKVAFEGRPKFVLPNPINIGIVLYFGVCLFSSMLAFRIALPLFDQQEAFFTLLKMTEYYMIFVLTGVAIRTIRQIRLQLIVFFVVSNIISIYALYSHFLGGVDRVSAPFETGGTEPNTLGGYLVLVMCVSAALWTQAPTRIAKLLTFSVALLAFVPFLFTLSRASYLAFVAGLLVLGVVARKPSLIIGMILVLLFSQFLMPEEVRDRVNYTFQRGSGQEVDVGGVDTGVQVDKSTHERIYVWEKVNYNLHVWPWFGGGVSWDRVLDSHYARVLIESGLFGFVTFIFLQFRLLRTTRESYRWARHWIGRGVGMGIFVSTIALIVHSFGTISFLIVRIMEPYWFLVALACVVRSIAIQEHIVRKRNETRASTTPIPPDLFSPQPDHGAAA